MASSTSLFGRRLLLFTRRPAPPAATSTYDKHSYFRRALLPSKCCWRGFRSMSDENSADDDDRAVFQFLTLGDGDFSWSLDLARHLLSSRRLTSKSSDEGSESKSSSTRQQQQQQQQQIQLIATGIDSVAELQSKYRADCVFALRELERIGKEDPQHLQVQVRHEVNAIVDYSTSLPSPKSDLLADVVIFNHPHLGTEDARLHGQFLCHLFHSVHSVWLNPTGGVFYLTLAQGQFERWQCLDAATRHGLEILDRYEFVATPKAVQDPYYKHRRHQSGKSFANRTSGSETFAFVRRKREKPNSLVIATSRFPSLPWFVKETTFDDGESTGSERNTESKDAFSCPHCDKSFREERSLKNHIKSKHSESSNKRKRNDDLTCPYCRDEGGEAEPRIFADSSALDAHIRAKHKAIHTAILPDWAEANKSNSSTAIALLDGNAKPVGSCTICGYEYYSQQDEEEHRDAFVPSHHQCPTSTFACQFCAKQFSQRRAQLQHENFCPRRPVANASTEKPQVDYR